MTDTKLDLLALRKVAEDATQEQWEYERLDWEDGSISYEFNTDSMFIAIRERDYSKPMRARFDAAHIAAFSPKTALELLDEVDHLKAVNAELNKQRDAAFAESYTFEKRLESTDAACDVMERALEELRDEFADCTCDEPEKGHEMTTCHAYFAICEALESARKFRSTDK